MARPKAKGDGTSSVQPDLGGGTYLICYSRRSGYSSEKDEREGWCRIPIIRSSDLLRYHAFRWSYLIRNRNRWAYKDSKQANQLVDDAVALLLWLLGQTDSPDRAKAGKPADSDILERLAKAEMIEVSIPFRDEPTGWEYRILPWEYVLSAATEAVRRAPLFVVRHLRRDLPHGQPSTSGFLYVEAAPGKLRQQYDFASERALGHQLAGLLKSDADFEQSLLADPTLDEIGEAVRKLPPRTIHISGFDSWLAAAELKEGAYAKLHQDGYLLRDPNSGWGIAEAEEFAEHLINPKVPPRLVAFTIFNSGTRLAAMCVAKGAAAAIGYQDTFDARLGERFFAAFNRACTATDWDVAGSARYAWDLLKNSDEPLTGSGMIVWQAQSIQERRPAPIQAIKQAVEKAFHDSSAEATVGDSLEWEIKPKAAINYSTLHNQGALFDCFILRRKPQVTAEIRGILVSVRLQIGPHAYPFKMNTSLSVHQTAIDVAKDIVISLTADLVRELRDHVQTTLFIEVSHHDHVFYCRTHRIMLLPIDQWVDDDDNRRWLPSFVLPRDPAVRRIIDMAQKYLVALTDDPGAGFDGYQSVDVDKLDSDPDEACQSVDFQVRAIWSALLLDSPLAYINPPPTFTDSSQRVRTPSDTISGRRGTCIDLALLFAACLEYVEIHPVIVLLAGHAFPAYWRHSDYLDRFMAGQDIDLPAKDDDLDPDYVSALLGQSGRWSLGKGYYKRIMQVVDEGKLVPVESVMLTTRDSFADSVDQGRENFLGQDDFDSLLDINRARTDPAQPVTPLPIRSEEA
ncbi:MAG: hypothetical protein HYX38_32735 [Rhodospirillales bacterium]|nr:hypothetical protein [Rhodospirillales bacterium]